ncbi:Trehalase [Aphelenchoides bicaudatus]|nr:Trehalase [Aphelenchoides bicaudatus]
MYLTTSLVLSILFVKVYSDTIPEYYRTHDAFKDEDHVCNRQIVGERAGIYCHGRILESVMALKLYNDSKTFVDKPLLFTADVVLKNFEKIFPTDENITKVELQKFIDEHFGLEGKELETCDLTDWTQTPPKLSLIADPQLKQFAMDLNQIWKQLCRQINKTFENETELHSLIYVPKKFIVPGGRFREYYYWDSFWIIKGLLASGMHDTAKSMLTNLVYLVNKWGFVPNGGRIYYLARSQPPFLILMFYEYLEATGDTGFVLDQLPHLEREFMFWDNRRRVEVEINSAQHNMYQYRAESKVPRPESYREDVELVKNFNQTEREIAWRNLASAAESGNDFSSRWLRDKNLTDLSSIDTISIVPVDLNALMCRNLEILAHLFSLKQDDANEFVYRQRHQKFKQSFQKVFWNEREGAWFDYDLKTKRHRVNFYPQNFIPIFGNCYDTLDRQKVEKVYKRMANFTVDSCDNGPFACPNGIPSSQIKTGLQWDGANSWPPLEYMVIEGLRRTESPQLQEYAYEIASKWVQTNYVMFKTHGVMFEKYSASELNKGSGGEYETPVGFGWTNGVILELLTTYGQRLKSSDFLNSSNSVQSIPSNSVQPVQSETIPPESLLAIKAGKIIEEPAIESDHNLYNVESSSNSLSPLFIVCTLLFHLFN